LPNASFSIICSLRLGALCAGSISMGVEMRVELKDTESWDESKMEEE